MKQQYNKRHLIARVM